MNSSRRIIDRFLLIINQILKINKIGIIYVVNLSKKSELEI